MPERTPGYIVLTLDDGSTVSSKGVFEFIESNDGVAIVRAPGDPSEFLPKDCIVKRTEVSD